MPITRSLLDGVQFIIRRRSVGKCDGGEYCLAALREISRRVRGRPVEIGVDGHEIVRYRRQQASTAPLRGT